LLYWHHYDFNEQKKSVFVSNHFCLLTFPGSDYLNEKPCRKYQRSGLRTILSIFTSVLNFFITACKRHQSKSNFNILFEMILVHHEMKFIFTCLFESTFAAFEGFLHNFHETKKLLKNNNFFILNVYRWGFDCQGSDQRTCMSGTFERRKVLRV